LYAGYGNWMPDLGGYWGSSGVVGSEVDYAIMWWMYGE